METTEDGTGSGRGWRRMRERKGREYLRVSYDRSGRERSQDEQHDENADAAEGIGVRLLEAYREAGSASASRYATKVRDDFARLLADLEAGRFGAEVLVLWESSRGSRKVGEWVMLIEVCEQQCVTIFVTTHGREYDPANARDRRSLLEDAVDSEYESSKVSARAKRASAANAKAGKPHGRVPFGYVRRYDERTRRLIAQEPNPDEAPMIVALFEGLLRGDSFLALARRFKAEGYLNGKGAPFSAAHLRTLARTAAYGGIRLHNFGAPKGTHVDVTTPGVAQTDSAWPALVDREVFLRVQAILSDPKRVTTRGGKAKHFLSMIACCHVCGSVLSATFRNRGVGEYMCRTSIHIRCHQEELDRYAEDAILEYLARPEVHEKFTAGEDRSDEELKQVRARLIAVGLELDTLRLRVGAGELDVASLVLAEPGMLARIADLQAQEEQLATPSALRGLITLGADVRQRWADVPIAARRQIARVVLVPELLGQLRVDRRDPGYPANRHQPAEERVRWARTQPPTATGLPGQTVTV